MNVLRRLALATWIAAALGCAGKAQDSTGVGNPGLTTQEQALYDDGEEGRKAGDTASLLVSIPLATLTKAAHVETPDLAAAVGEAARDFYFQPAGCVATTRAANVVTFTFTDCTYKLGALRVNGVLEATYRAGPVAGSITVDARNVGPFAIEGFDKLLRPVSIDVTIEAKTQIEFVDETTKKVDWQGTYTAKLGDFTLDHRPSYRATIETDVNCFGLAGNATTTINGRGVETTFSSYRRCGGPKACPQAGGTFELRRIPKGLTLAVEFLGGPDTRVTIPGRPPFETSELLRCGG